MLDTSVSSISCPQPLSTELNRPGKSVSENLVATFLFCFSTKSGILQMCINPHGNPVR